ncbi:MAG TPA: tail fiber protein [Gemmataceae bacterium]|nr:tail fiber protein [Gemmataceae bacterium]HTZ03454.1 tail fiber protein [Xanthobacteraceae bacterium]
MTQPFLGQVQAFGFGFAPRYWAQCNGQVLTISQNAALFSLLGTYYGGNGTTTFALPNLQSRVPMHNGSFNGNNYAIGQQGGEENVMLTLNTMPLHGHSLQGTSTAGDDSLPAAGSAPAKVGDTGGDLFYAADTTVQPLTPGSIGPAGGNQPHTNIQPYLAINWCIALNGIYPSRG